MTAPAFGVARADYARDGDALRAVREAVFIHEQGVPAALERDVADATCLHVLARNADGRPIGTGRIAPPGAAGPAKVGRMAVLRDWRSRGVGDALLLALLDAARGQGWREVQLHAQAPAIRFYLRHGFLPRGPRFEEAGIEHLAMWRTVDGTMATTDVAAARAVVVALATSARRELRIRSRDLDPGVLDAPEVLDALRRFATGRRGAQARILLLSAEAPRRVQAPLLPLAQRLPSVFAFREATDPVDQVDPSACVVDDRRGSWFRSLGHRIEGEARLDAPARARQLRLAFDRAWERSRPITEYRVLGA